MTAISYDSDVILLLHRRCFITAALSRFDWQVLKAMKQYGSRKSFGRGSVEPDHEQSAAAVADCEDVLVQADSSALHVDGEKSGVQADDVHVQYRKRPFAEVEESKYFDTFTGTSSSSRAGNDRSDFASGVAGLFLKNKLSAKETIQIAQLAKADGATGVNHIASAAGGGTH